MRLGDGYEPADFNAERERLLAEHFIPMFRLLTWVIK